MSDLGQPVYRFQDDPALKTAQARAQRNFRYFIRELQWDRNRIVPTLDLAIVKIGFWDQNPKLNPQAEVEYMWVTETDFDGKLIHGVLMNTPNHLRSIKEGDSVTLPLERMVDWMYAISSQVYGGYSVDLMRRTMGSQELRAHDQAWGLEFATPGKVQLVPNYKHRSSPKDGFLQKLLRKKKQPEAVQGLDAEHPLSIAGADSLRQTIQQQPELLHKPGLHGLTLLASQAMQGNTSLVKVLLEEGADPQITNRHGQTPLDLARLMGWPEVVELLRSPR